MSLESYREQLCALESKLEVTESDFPLFLKTLDILADVMQDENQLPQYGPLVKEWLSSFQTIFGKNEIQSKLMTCMTQLCSETTEVFLKLLESIVTFDRNYTQEFYCHWIEILLMMESSQLASSFIRHIAKLKVILTHLRNAHHRCEQLTILKIFTLYTEHMPLSELDKLRDHITDDGTEIIDWFIQSKQQSPTFNDHEFLYYVNSMSESISSFRPIGMGCSKSILVFIKTEYEMWIDFNLKDSTILLAATSLTDTDRFLAFITKPKLTECLVNDKYHQLIVKGTCTILRNNDLNRQRLAFAVLFPLYVRRMIWRSKVKSVFKINPYKNYRDAYNLKDNKVDVPSKISRTDESAARKNICNSSKTSTLQQIHNEQRAVSNSAENNFLRPNEENKDVPMSSEESAFDKVAKMSPHRNPSDKLTDLQQLDDDQSSGISFFQNWSLIDAYEGCADNEHAGYVDADNLHQANVQFPRKQQSITDSPIEKPILEKVIKSSTHSSFADRKEFKLELEKGDEYQVEVDLKQNLTKDLTIEDKWQLVEDVIPDCVSVTKWNNTK